MKKNSRAEQTKRRRRYRQGLTSETIAAMFLRLKGYRILARRYKTAVGEIDLVAKRGLKISFIEVKNRSTLQEAQSSITNRQRQRIRHAAARFMSRQPRLQDCEQTFDLVFVVPWALPKHLPNAL